MESCSDALQEGEVFPPVFAYVTPLGDEHTSIVGTKEDCAVKGKSHKFRGF